MPSIAPGAPRGPDLAEIADDPDGILAFNVREPDTPVQRHYELCNDDDVLALARRIYPVFPEVPVHGIDLVRETRTGRLFIMECNPGGGVWHFSSPTSRRLDPELINAIRNQFGAMSRAADMLIEKTRAEAA